MKSVSEVERFWSKVKKGETDECWEWTGRAFVSGGYGGFDVKRGGLWKSARAHCYSYELKHGPTGGLFVCHTCDNPKCVNPNHLFLGTHQDNMKDKVKKGRHLVGERTYNAKLTDEKVREIRVKVASGQSARVVARAFGINEKTVRGIMRRERWSHVV